MPSRILREGILTSEAVARLSDRAELFYRRLMSVADDYGRFFSHPGILRASCYPLKLDKVTEPNVQEWLEECEKVGLIQTYGKKFLEIANFRQRTRSKSKFPDPPHTQPVSGLTDNCPSIDRQLHAGRDKPASAPTPTPTPTAHTITTATPTPTGYHGHARTVLWLLNEESGKHFRETDPNLSVISQRLKEPEVTFEGVKAMIKRQCKRWKGNSMEEYLRPETLFGKTKFDSYYASRDQPIADPNPRPSNPRNVGMHAGNTDFEAAARKKSGMGQAVAGPENQPPSRPDSP